MREKKSSDGGEQTRQYRGWEVRMKIVGKVKTFNVGFGEEETLK